jgi:hypothetical protein
MMPRDYSRISTDAHAFVIEGSAKRDVQLEQLQCFMGTSHRSLAASGNSQPATRYEPRRAF